MDIIAGFLEQPVVPFLLALACVPMLLLAAYTLYVFLYRLPRRYQQQQVAQVAASVDDGLAELQRTKSYDTGELPDLDLLVAELPKASGVRVLSDQSQQVRLANGAVVAAQELMSVLRDKRDGRLMVLFGDTGYRSLAEASEAKREFTRLMKELAAVIMQPDDSPPEPASASTPAPAPAKPEPAPPPAQKLPKMELPPAPRDTTLPGDLPSYRFDDNPASIQIGRLGVRKVEFTPPPAVDIASAIEQFLQFKLAQTGMFKGRDIHILPNPSGGVKIRVDSAFYDFVDEIQDLEVRAFIQATIAEWQERQG